MSRSPFLAGLALMASMTAAQADLPTGTLSFVQRTGTVANNVAIPVVMRLTLNADSAPLTFSSDPLTGFASADLPTEGQFFNTLTNANETRLFASITGAYLNTVYSCQGDFTTVCGPSSNYRFEFNTTDSAEHPSINFRESFTLNAGESYEYTFGFFVPVAGGATPGVYRWNGTAVTLNFRGLDADGNQGIAFEAMSIGTGGSMDPDLAFERTVMGVVPEPGSYGLMALGLLGLGALQRRRTR